jgi:hypothetical protein
MAGQLVGLRQQYERTTGRKNSFDQEFLTDRTQDVLERHGRAAPTPAPSAQNFEEGKIYVDAKGNRARYENGKWSEVK